MRFIDTVCQPTKQRQNAAIELAQSCDVVVVIGGAHSNNTHELVRTCSRYCRRVHHVQTAADLQPDWFADAANGRDHCGNFDSRLMLVQAVEQWLNKHADLNSTIKRRRTSSGPSCARDHVADNLQAA